MDLSNSSPILPYLPFGGYIPPPNTLLSFAANGRLNDLKFNFQHMNQPEIHKEREEKEFKTYNHSRLYQSKRRLQHGPPVGASGPGKQPVTKCYQCKKSFNLLIDLNEHFMHEHASILQKEFDNSRYWKCNTAADISNVIVQPLYKKGNIDSTPGYQCPKCKYFAKWPTELQKHMMVHSKERPHQCVICGLTYKWKWDLGRHFDKSHQSTNNPYKKNPSSSVKVLRQTDMKSIKLKNPLTGESMTHCSINNLNFPSFRPIPNDTLNNDNKTLLKLFVKNYMAFVKTTFQQSEDETLKQCYESKK